MSSALYDAYKTAHTAEQNGVWVPMTGGRFLLARMGGSNLKFQRQLSQATKPHMREIQLGIADTKSLDEIMLKVFVDTVLLNWDGVEDQEQSTEEAPVSLPFSKDAALKLLSDLPDLYAQLRDQAQSYANFLASSVEIMAKN